MGRQWEVIHGNRGLTSRWWIPLKNQRLLKLQLDLKLTCLRVVDVIFIDKHLVEDDGSGAVHGASERGREREAWDVGI